MDVARGGGDAIGNLSLEHEVHVPDVLGLGQEMEEERGGDVVGEVSDDAQGVIGVCQCGEVEIQGVGDVEGEGLRELGGKASGEVPIEFYCMEMPDEG